MNLVSTTLLETLSSIRHQGEYFNVQNIYSSHLQLYFLLLCNPNFVTLVYNCTENVGKLVQRQQLTSY